MGAELAQPQEWNHDGTLSWELLDDPGHAGVKAVIADLNRLYQKTPSLYATDMQPDCFRWLVSDDMQNSVFAFARADDLVVVVNMTPVVRHDYRIGVPRGGRWREAVNTDSAFYGGSDVGNGDLLETQEIGSHGSPQSLSMTLPPLATLILTLAA
jgi:1,4-alpha-glucan branching enzyme